VEEGAIAFLNTEYYYLGIFMVRGAHRAGLEGGAGAGACATRRLVCRHACGRTPALSPARANAPPQVIMSVLIFSLLSIVTPEGERTRSDEVGDRSQAAARACAR
jgi:hypothetical protein